MVHSLYDASPTGTCKSWGLSVPQNTRRLLINVHGDRREENGIVLTLAVTSQPLLLLMIASITLS